MTPTGSPDTSESYLNLVIHAEGPATSGGRIPLVELARIASGFQATLERLALSISGKGGARGRRPREIVDAVSLNFVGFRHGSAVLEINRSGQLAWTNDLLAESLEAFEQGVAEIRDGAIHSPRYFTPQVLNGLRDLTGGISPNSLTRIGFMSDVRTLFVIDRTFRAALHRVGPSVTEERAVIIGRLLMGDFSPASLRCRIDTYAGSVLCDFDGELRDTVLDSMDLLVKAHGLAEMQPDGSTIRLLHLEGLEVVREARMRTLDALAREQNVRPLSDMAELRGEPIEDFDDFLDAVRSARRG